jgi:hypothetical protein
MHAVGAVALDKHDAVWRVVLWRVDDAAHGIKLDFRGGAGLQHWSPAFMGGCAQEVQGAEGYLVYCV